MRSRPTNTYELLQRGAQDWADAVALRVVADAREPTRSQTWTYRALLARVTQAANLFHALGAGPDTVVAYALSNVPQAHFVLWGAEAAGIAFAMNPALGAEASAQLLAAAGASILVTMAPSDEYPLLLELAPLLEQCPQLQHILIVGRTDASLPATPGIELRPFDDALDLQPHTRLISDRVIRAEDEASRFCTGGTTGLPKIARRRHANEVANAAMLREALGAHVGPGRRYFCGLPLFHVNATIITGLLPWISGGEVVLGPAAGYRDKDLTANFWSLVEAHRINIFSGVPTIFSALLQQPTRGRELGSLDFAICGAAPMPVELFRHFEQATGLRIIEAYGLTESTCVATLNPVDGERRIGSIGQALPQQDLCIAILDDAGRYLREAAVDEVGVVALRGPNIFDGYLSPVHNAGLWIEDGRGAPWLNSGDLGRRDAQGYVWLAGRKKQLIIRGGHNIDPAIIEEALHAHPAVALAAAVGRPDARVGELPVAYVQLRAGADVNEAELLRFAASRIGEAAARPKAVHILLQMPVTAVGKIYKPRLVEAEIADVVREEARALGVELDGVQVRNDARLGLLAEVSVRRGSAALEQALARYSFASTMRCQEQAATPA